MMLRAVRLGLMAVFLLGLACSQDAAKDRDKAPEPGPNAGKVTPFPPPPQFFPPRDNGFSIGQPAPEIEGEDIDGQPFKLSDYRGKVVVLDFWGHW